MFQSFTLKDIRKLQAEVVRKPTGTRPALWRIKKDNKNAIIKDFSSNGLLFRNTIGRFLIWRESTAYKKLKGLKGIPEFYRSIEGKALLLEDIQGKDIEIYSAENKPGDFFFRELKKVVEDFHKHGIAHCDLKRAPNIIVGDNGRPYIVDWSASISEKGFRIFPLNYIYRRFVQDDLNAITKLRLKYCPEKVSFEEKRKYYHKSPVEKAIRAVRDKARALLQKLA
ncbi:MAG: hypothetical protein JW882_15055 [Deltaproteobacteria bacterium]|nr:hypothetical protein [Deltaproteobacteria bacterium]